MSTPNLTFEESHKAKDEGTARYSSDQKLSVVDLFVVAMDLSSPKVGSDEKLALCKKYFYIGFAFLPLLWAVNAVWFVNAAYSVSKLSGLVTFCRKCHL